MSIAIITKIILSTVMNVSAGFIYRNGLIPMAIPILYEVRE